MLILARVKVSGEIGGLLIYIAIIGIIGGICSSLISFARDKIVKSESVKKVLSRIELMIWVALVIFGILDVLGIVPTLSQLFN